MALDLMENVIRDLQPEKLFENVFKEKIKTNGFKKIIIISIGKAAKPMAKAILKYLPRKPDQVFLADVGHPLPTAAALGKTKKIMAAAQKLSKDDLALVFISGGGSAMFESPIPGLTLNQLIQITKNLLKSGATIQEINTVRKQLSQVKGGRLAELLYPATVKSFVISDVLGNNLSSIASGPLTPSNTNASDALNIIKKYSIHIPTKTLSFLKNSAKKTKKTDTKYFKNLTTEIIADHKKVLQITARHAQKYGLKVVASSSFLSGEAKNVVKDFLQKALQNSIFIATGETTVTCKGTGFGGRNQEFVLSGLQYLKPGQTLVSFGTDGIDGICPQKIAGALADENTLQLAKKQKLAFSKYLDNNDSYNFFKKTNGLIKTGATGTNVGDVAFVIS